MQELGVVGFHQHRQGPVHPVGRLEVDVHFLRRVAVGGVNFVGVTKERHVRGESRDPKAHPHDRRSGFGEVIADLQDVGVLGSVQRDWPKEALFLFGALMAQWVVNRALVVARQDLFDLF